jgi:hypothetical protein
MTAEEANLQTMGVLLDSFCPVERSDAEKAAVTCRHVTPVPAAMVSTYARLYDDIVAGRQAGECLACGSERSTDPTVWPRCSVSCTAPILNFVPIDWRDEVGPSSSGYRSYDDWDAEVHR